MKGVKGILYFYKMNTKKNPAKPPLGGTFFHPFFSILVFSFHTFHIVYYR